MEKEVKKRRGGLEFVPLPKGHTEADFEIPRGKKHPGQLDVLCRVRFLGLMSVRMAGRGGEM